MHFFTAAHFGATILSQASILNTKTYNNEEHCTTSIHCTL